MNLIPHLLRHLWNTNEDFRITVKTFIGVVLPFAVLITLLALAGPVYSNEPPYDPGCYAGGTEGWEPGDVWGPTDLDVIPEWCEGSGPDSPIDIPETSPEPWEIPITVTGRIEYGQPIPELTAITSGSIPTLPPTDTE